MILSSSRSTERTVPRSREGFTIVEVIVAMLILVVGVVGLAAGSAQIIRQITLADLESERSVAFQTVIEQLQASPYDNVANGTSTVGVFDVSWAVANDGAQSKIVTITTVGPGVRANSTLNDPARSETFIFRVLRR